MRKTIILSCICLLLLVSLAAAPVLAATLSSAITCPSSCSCLLPAEAKKMGYPGYCEGKQRICAYDSQKREKFCYEKPVTTTTVVPQLIITAHRFVTTTPTTDPLEKCASGCTCLSSADGKRKGLQYCGGEQTLCGYNTDKTPLYCFSLPTTPTTTPVTTRITVMTTTPTTIPGPVESCAAGCQCLSLDKADLSGFSRCNSSAPACSYDPLGRSMYCYAVPSVTMVSPVPADGTPVDITQRPPSDQAPVNVSPRPPSDDAPVDVSPRPSDGPVPVVRQRTTTPVSDSGFFTAISSFFTSLFGGAKQSPLPPPPLPTPSTTLTIAQGPSQAFLSLCRMRYGLDYCNGACVNLSTDPQNCRECGRTCYSNEVCCDGRCVLNTTADNCGTCRNACPEGSPCQNGVCDPHGCYYGNTLCDNACVSLNSDRNNCGACGNVCPADTRCRFGTCVACSSGMTVCRNNCFNLSEDRDNCGDCRTTCADDEICSGGSCIACTGIAARCDNACVNTASDHTNCGLCGHTCPAGTFCNYGECVCPGFEHGIQACPVFPTGSVACADTRTDPENCGGCHGGIGLSPYQCDEGESCCNGKCANLQADHNNCGTCGVRCGLDKTRGAMRCNTGTCMACDRDYYGCFGESGVVSCVNLETSRFNCGACDIRCGEGEVCCNGQCADFRYDEENCGECGHACGSGEQCCSGVCKDVLSDDNNCGSCRRECHTGHRHCFMGQCCDATGHNCE